MIAAANEYPAANLYIDYTRSLKAYNAVDFDDLILLPVLLFQQHPPFWKNGKTRSAICWSMNTRTPISPNTSWYA